MGVLAVLLLLLVAPLSFRWFVRGFFQTKRDTWLHSDPNSFPGLPVFIFGGNEFLGVVEPWNDAAEFAEHWTAVRDYDGDCPGPKSREATGLEIAQWVDCRTVSEVSHRNEWDVLDIWAVRHRKANRLFNPVQDFPLRLTDRLIIFVIDALRYDFMKWGCLDYTVNKNASLWYLHSMPLTRDVVEAGTARLMKFVADAPTVTMQRVKSLASGTLPTFFEITNSFEGVKVPVDNLLLQLQKQRALRDPSLIPGQIARKGEGLSHAHERAGGLTAGPRVGMAHVGDDVWSVLFPSLVSLSIPFDSFDVPDLDSVDIGVYTHFRPLIRDSPRLFNFVVGHNLGVDHVGHHHRIDHPKMREKLETCDSYIMEIAADLDNDYEEAGTRSVFLTFGDHGQTWDGTHGGVSPPETDSALLVRMSGLKPMSVGVPGSNDTYRQLDFTATAAVLLGVPIPFENLGGIMADVIPSTDNEFEDLRLLAKLTVLNVGQIRRYAVAYETLHKENLGSDGARKAYHTFLEAYDTLWKMYWRGETSVEMLRKVYTNIVQQGRLYQQELAEGAVEQWAKFDYPALYKAMAAVLVLCVGLGATLLAGSLSTPITFAPTNSWALSPPSYTVPIAVIAVMCISCASECFYMKIATVHRGLFAIVSAWLPYIAVGRRSTQLDAPLLPTGLPWLLPMVPLLNSAGRWLDPSENADSGGVILLPHGRLIIWITAFAWQMAGSETPQNFRLILQWGNAGRSAVCAFVIAFIAADSKPPAAADVWRFRMWFSLIVISGFALHLIRELTLLLTRRNPIISQVEGAALRVCHTAGHLLIALWGCPLAGPTSVIIFTAIVCRIWLQQRTTKKLYAGEILAASMSFGMVCFVTTGHRYNFNAIPIAAGFYATGTYHSVRSAVCTYLHCFGCFLLAIPLGFTRIPSLLQFQKDRDAKSTASFATKVALSISLYALTAQISLYALRHQICVWHKHAPRFVYDVLGGGLATFLLLFFSCAAIRATPSKGP